ncbi:MAG TPA: YceI family protein [Candidatus Kapabacteria bacterium]|nr:YceI family protein [Candidatus Kapabacteria bacterium]
METSIKQTAEQQVATKQTTWQLDPVHTTVKFSVRHMVVAEVSGRFSKFEGTIVRPTEDFSGGAISVKINAASINTDNEMRDNHLRSADFFDVENHPELIFKSRSFEKTGNDEYKILGDLTMHGVTKPVELKAEYFGEMKDWEGKRHIGFKAEGALNRTDYGLTYNMALEAGGVVVGEKIKLHLDVEAIEAPETANAVSLN